MRPLKKEIRHSGIALLLTLVILSLVTVFMTEFFFETTLEIRAIENFKSSFVSQTVVKSMFKAMLVGLALNETDFFNYLKEIYQITGSLTEEVQEISFLNPPKQLLPLPAGTIPDFEDATVYTPYIRPIDHLFNLNRIQKKTGIGADTAQDRIHFNQFVNEISQIPIEIEQEGEQTNNAPTEFRFLELAEASQLYAAIFDWLDTREGGEPYSNAVGVTGAEAEAYTEFEVDTELEIKNRGLDRLSEIRLIAGIAESGVPYEEWERRFTIFNVGVQSDTTQEFEARLNINLANKDEIVSFLRRFEQSSEYYSELGGPPDNSPNLQKYFEHAEEVADAAILYNENEERIIHDKRSLINALKVVEDIGDNHEGMFIYYSQWYEIRLVAEVDNIQSEIRAIVFIPRNATGADSGKAVIKDFILR